MNRLTAATLGITMAALIVGFALGTQFPSSSPTLTVSQSTASQNTTSIICTSLAESGVLVRVINQTGSPIVGVPVSSYTDVYCFGQEQITINPVNMTNSDGWADLEYGEFGNYYVSVLIGVINYNFTVPTVAQANSIVTYNIYSGNMTVRFCGFTGNPQYYPCNS